MNNNNKIYEKYRLAYTKLRSIFGLIYDEFNIREEVNPIEHIKYRIKKFDSIEKKLIKKGYPVTEENIDKFLYDVVGVRIVCSFLSDLETLKKVIRGLEHSGVLEIVREKDYVSKPKVDSGYSSYHLGIRIPVNYNNQVTYVNAEIQIRTIAMDMAASLEHKSCYKKEGYSNNLKKMIREATYFSNEIDRDLDSVVKLVNNNKVEKLSLDYPFMKEIEYKLFKSKYESAMEGVKDKLLDLYRFYDKSDVPNPIEHVKSRIKGDDEIVRKLLDKFGDQNSVNIENIKNHVSDVAGVRIVCSFLSEIEDIKEFILNDGDFLIIEEKDYINNPKDSGYRGYHIIVGVPLFTLEGLTYVKVEIQIRTIAMEMWASLEEKIGYHKEIPSYISSELKRNSSIISVFDSTIDNIYNKSREQQLQVNKKKKVKKLNVKKS